MDQFLSPASASSANILSFATAALWPIVALVAVLVFKKDIIALSQALASRATSVTLGPLGSIDLGGVTATRLETVEPLSEFGKGQDADDSSGGLLDVMRAGDPIDYVTVDLGDDKAWLTTRLYLLATLAARQRRFRAIVFVVDDGGKPKYLNFAFAAPLAEALARQYPWLRQRLGEAESNYKRGSTGRFDDGIVKAIFDNYKSLLKDSTNLRAASPKEWTEVKPDQWEHGQWVAKTDLRALIGDQPAVEYDAGMTQIEFARRLLRTSGDWVPVVNKSGIFRRVVKRGEFLDRIARRLADEGA